MPEPKELAKQARSTLAQALSALQAPDAPAALLTIAEPIAKTMGALHKIERGNEDLERCEEALSTARDVLNALQSTEVDHPAVDGAMEGVAGSLSKLFALTRAIKSRKVGRLSSPEQRQLAAAVAAERAGRAAGSAAIDPGNSVKVATPTDRAAAVDRAAAARRPTPLAIPAALSPHLASAAPQLAAPGPQLAAPAPQLAAPPASPQQPVAQQPVAQQPVAQQPVVQRPPAPAAAGWQMRAPQVPAPQVPTPEAAGAPRPGHGFAPRPAPRLAAEERPLPATPPIDPSAAPGGLFEVGLASHSQSNFYRGLMGEDVIEHGGLFVATYKLPKLGSRVALRVVFPGDLELNALADVRWLREPGAGDVHPGFGAKLHPLPEQARKLVDRFVRNREPMFYDDEL